MNRPAKPSTTNDRNCIFADCQKKAVRGQAYCRQHASTDEAKTFNNQLTSMAQSIEDMPHIPLEATAPDPAEDPYGYWKHTRPDEYEAWQTLGGRNFPGDYPPEPGYTTKYPVNHPLSGTRKDLKRIEPVNHVRNARIEFQEELKHQMFLEQYDREEKFTRRLKEGKYESVLDAALNNVLNQAAEQLSFKRAYGALQLLIEHSLAVEVDVHRQGQTISRAVNAMARLTIAEYTSRPAQPVARYGQKWNPPLTNESFVHFVWRHKPEDFIERYMANLNEPDQLPATIDADVEADWQAEERSNQPRTDDNGRYLPPALNPGRKNAIERRTNPRPEDHNPDHIRYQPAD